MARRPESEIRRRRHVVYRHYDTDGQLLYVVCCGNLSKRTYEHTDSAWARHAVRCEGIWYDDLPSARAAESEAIRTEKPIFNVHGQGAPRGTYDVERRQIMDRYLHEREGKVA